MVNWLQSMTAKVLGVALLALLMLIPLANVHSLVGEREGLRQQAVAKVSQGWGGRQTLGGMVLAVPTSSTVTDDDHHPVTSNSMELVLPDTLVVASALSVERRTAGIYAVPVFLADVTLSGRIDAASIAAYRRASSANWAMDKAELRLVLADPQGLRELTDVSINGRPATFASSAARIGGLPVIAIPLDVGDGDVHFAVRLKLAGTQSLHVLPLGRQSDVTIQAPWKDPSFVGASLPTRRTVDAKGFQASWRTLDLNRDYGQHWNVADTGIDARIAASASGVELYETAGVYQQNDRANKYAILFIALTFVTFFLYEVLQRSRVHPLQYLLVGAAMASFYVLLLALSEQIGFGLAYLVAAGVVVLMVAGYASAVLRIRRAGWQLGGLLVLVYGVLYGLIGAEEFALLIGAVVMLGVVALMMFVTRRIDWYAYGSSRPAAAGDH